MKLSVASNIKNLTPDQQALLVGEVVRIAVYKNGDDDTPLSQSVGVLKYLIIQQDQVTYALEGFVKDGRYYTSAAYGMIQWLRTVGE